MPRVECNYTANLHSRLFLFLFAAFRGSSFWPAENESRGARFSGQPGMSAVNLSQEGGRSNFREREHSRRRGAPA
jgi:hypothetical protein